MRALFDAARKEKNSKKQLETYCPTRWASAHACLHSYVLNIDVFRFLDEDQGAIAKDFRKMCEKDSESIFKVFFDRDSQMAVRQLEALFRGLAAANKFMEATGAHLAEGPAQCNMYVRAFRRYSGATPRPNGVKKARKRETNGARERVGLIFDKLSMRPRFR